jgi:hypothetical protein
MKTKEEYLKEIKLRSIDKMGEIKGAFFLKK